MGDAVGEQLRVAPDVTRGVTRLVNRMVAFYALLSLLPGAGSIVAQLPGTALWWRLSAGLGVAVSLVAMVVQAVRGTSMRGPAAAFAFVVLLGVATGPWAFGPQPPHSQPWIWWNVGPAVVCVALWRGFRVSVAYAVVLAVLFGLLRPSAAFGGADLQTAVSEAVYAPVASLAIVGVGLGMIRAARGADRLAESVYRRTVAAAVGEALAVERVRLDRLIHDDVMTTLVAVTHAVDPATTDATARLAGETLTRIDELRAEPEPGGVLGIEAFVQLADETARRVSYDVAFVDEMPAHPVAAELPVAVAEAFLAAMRESVRNAVRHASAQHVEVRCRLVRPSGRSPVLELEVADDGVGFDVSAVPPERLGVGLSIVGPLAEVGAYHRIVSRPGHGTTVVMGHRLTEAGPVRDPPGAQTGRYVLPAQFPGTKLTRLLWLVVGVQIGLGLLNLDRVAPQWPAVVAMVAMLGLTWAVTRPGTGLQLPIAHTWTVVALDAVVSVLVTSGLPTDRWPDAGLWHLFPLQLILVALVVRRRAWAAVACLSVMVVVTAAWALPSPLGPGGLVMAVFGGVSFLAMALVVTHTLGTIACRQRALHDQESVALRESARRFVAVVQRSLWLADLKQSVRGTLTRVAEVSGPVPPALQDEAALLEATLREALMARNVMSEELAELTEAARRRGVSVVVVDSRQSPVSAAVGQTLLAEVRTALRSGTVSRVVVRMGPDGREELASVVWEDGGETRRTTISTAGVRAERLAAAGPPGSQ